MDPLQTLELSPGCSLEDAQKNFRRLSFLYHPDKNPGKEEQFKDIVNAYDLIKKNPDILKLSNKTTSNYEGYICVDFNVTLEDLYFGKTKIISIKRKVLCRTCNGYGTKDKIKGVCSLCRGAGSINNDILGMLKKSSNRVCPACKGAGVKKEFICNECSGSKLKDELCEIQVWLDLKDYKTGYQILRGVGDIDLNGVIGDILIRLSIEKDPLFTVEDNTLCFIKDITPAQKFIRAPCEVVIYGKKFVFRVPRVDNYIVLEDKREGLKYPQKIIARVNLIQPVLNRETKKLYRQIIKLESQAMPPQEDQQT